MGSIRCFFGHHDLIPITEPETVHENKWVGYEEAIVICSRCGLLANARKEL